MILATAGMLLWASPSHAIIGLLGVKCKNASTTSSSSAKGITTTINAPGSDGQNPFAIKAFNGFIAIIPVSGNTAGVQVRSGLLTSQEAYGEGLPNSSGPPSFAGPYTGLMWPFRDIYERASTGGNANDVGKVFVSPSRFAISASLTDASPFLGYAVGGPTETQIPGADGSVNRLLRGVPGNGVVPIAGPESGAGIFSFDIDVGSLGPTDFDISFIGTIDVVLQSNDGSFRQLNGVAVDATPVRVTIPAPSAVLPLAAMGLLATRRRR
ncbi:MAG: hypothetical protein K2W85_00750 [Phycisphaerales bacterium]|nr:hypothetical protein [Phycisphaerales bacterium]